ncbi:angiopoietin-1 receptor-like [Apostichopus japonicus]|uniref:angiopoietin-1 receptor-like n=1 Tax=Stichopus japonicus TaxID=307972 RepID=UPI003AB11DF9
MTNKVQVIAVITFLLWQTLLSYGQNEPVKMTFLGVHPFESENSNTHYQCHLSESDNIAATAQVGSFRAVWTRDDANENVDPPASFWNDAHKHWRVTLNNNGNNDAFGVFGCEAALDGRITTSISGIFIRSDADIVPSDELVSVTVNAGDTGVSIGMKSTGSKNVADFRWSKDNVRNNDINGQDTWVISGQVEVDDAGVYECHIIGERSGAKQGLKLLIVRACPAHRWGLNACDGICDHCYNGGICDENSGKCICAPGFKRTNCELGCGGNRYGDTCEKKCSRIDDPEKCSKYLFCLAHPYGCSCNTGWKGLDCLTACDSGTYGASCLQTCHCQSGQCDRYTGVCTGSPAGCSSGWTGTNCQECLGPHFGEDCENDCHCSESYCNQVTGSCSGGCNPEWVELFSPNLCQTGLIDAAYTRKNPGVTVPVTCTAEKGPSSSDINQLNIVLSRHHENLDDNGISPEEVFGNITTRTATFMVDNVTDGQTLYCQLRKDGNRYAVYNITIDVFDLPVLQSTPKADLITDSTVTISWSAWDEENEYGDSPVIGYTPYYKLASGLNWSIQDTSTSIKTLNFTFTALTSEERYSFCVAAVREGEKGEGPKSPALNATTTCGVDQDEPMNVTAEVAGDDQENVKISWKLPTGGSSCSDGVTLFTIYYASINLEPSHVGIQEVKDPSSTSFTLTGLRVEGNYSIQMTRETTVGESSSSNTIYYFVPRLPQYQAVPAAGESSSISLTITWPVWDGDVGTPPVVEYRLLTKLSESSVWPSTFIRVNASNDQDKYAVIITSLEPDTDYDFRVVAVREGPNGDGPPGPILEMVKTNSPDTGSVGLIVGVTIGTVSLAIIALVAVYGIWKYRRSTSKPKTVERQADDSKEVTSEAPFAYENVSKDSGHANVVHYVPSKKHEECILSPTGNDDTTDGYEIPSTRKDGGAQAKQESNKWENMEDVRMYQNNADDEFSLRKPMAISRFPLFIRSSTDKEMISATFKSLEEVSPGKNAGSFSGASPENLHKNRFGDIVPLDNHRPLLKSVCLTQGGNDYINASVVNIPGLNQTLIMTQAPLPNTVEDFWRLVFDYQCQTIIMLNDSDSGNHDTIKY